MGGETAAGAHHKPKLSWKPWGKEGGVFTHGQVRGEKRNQTKKNKQRLCDGEIDMGLRGPGELQKKDRCLKKKVTEKKKGSGRFKETKIRKRRFN